MWLGGCRKRERGDRARERGMEEHTPCSTARQLAESTGSSIPQAVLCKLTASAGCSRAAAVVLPSARAEELVGVRTSLSIHDFGCAGDELG